MKPSYRILGLMWDGMPECEIPIVKMAVADVPQRLGIPRTLFELDYLARSVSCLDLLSVESEDELATKLDGLDDCDEVQVDLGDLPKDIGDVPRLFFLHRARQVCGLIQRRNPSVKVGLVRPEKDAA